MKKLGSISLAILMTLCVGCGNEAKAPVEEPIQEVVTDIAKQEEVHKFVEKDFQDFFKDYFSFKDSELLVLNQQRATTDEGYWKNLKDDYKKLIGDKLGNYLSDSLKNRLKIQYLHDQINLPKFVLMNNYVISGQGEVKDIAIKSTRELGESVIYEVAVTTTNKCYPVAEFESQYTWGKTEGYFIKKQGAVAPDVNTQVTNSAQPTGENYMYSSKQSTDEMKIEQNFWVTVADQKELKVESIQTASDWGVAATDKNQLLDGQYITRVAYEEKPSEAEVALMNRVFTTLFQQPKSVYDYLNAAYHTSAEAFGKVFDELGFQKKFTVLKDSYKEAYPMELNPYKDEIATLKVNEKGIRVTPSIYSTLYQPRFIVTVPVEALHNNNQVVYYSYKYCVGMENDVIEFLQFMSANESDKYEYDYGTKEETLVKFAKEFGVDQNALAEAAKSVNMSVEELIAKAKADNNANPISVAEAIKLGNGAETQSDTQNK